MLNLIYLNKYCHSKKTCYGLPMKNKPRLITIAGLSGSGKSTLARALVAALPEAVLVESDTIRKELNGVPMTQKLPEEAYSREATEKLIAETNRRMIEAFAAGKTVVQTTVLSSPAGRERQAAFAAENGATFQGIWLQTDLGVLFDRVSKRKGDASDATAEIVQRQASRSPGEITWPVIDAGQPREKVLRQALEILAKPAAPGKSPSAPKP